MADGMSKDCAIARAGIDCIAGVIGHMLFIGQRRWNSKLQSGRVSRDSRALRYFGRGERLRVPNLKLRHASPTHSQSSRRDAKNAEKEEQNRLSLRPPRLCVKTLVFFPRLTWK